MPWGGHAIERVWKRVTRVRAGYQYDRFRENSETILILRAPLTVWVAEDRCEQTTYGTIELVANTSGTRIRTIKMPDRNS